MDITKINMLNQKNKRALAPCYLAALAGLLFGLDIGAISGALPFIAQEFHINDNMQEWIVSSMMIGAACGALIAGELSSRYGRKLALIIASLLFLFGSIICAISLSPELLVLGRIILGLAVGIASFTTPLYLSEVAPPNLRGSMISLYQLMITVGILIAFLSNTAFSFSGNWRWMLGIIAFPAGILLCSILVLPNSPRWLMSRGRHIEAKRVLLYLRGNKIDTDTELHEIDEVLRTKQCGWKLFISKTTFRKSLLLGILLQIAQQFTGINVVMYYAPRIVSLAGFTLPQQQVGATVLIGLVNVFATFIAIALVDRQGRKSVLYTGFSIMATGMSMLGMLFYIGIVTEITKILAVIMLLIVVAGFAMSAGPVIWVLCSEIQPTRGRDFGISVSTFTNWTSNALTGITFLSLINKFGPTWTFLGYAILNLSFIILVYFFVPETTGVTLEQIEKRLLSGLPLRKIGR